MSKLTHSMKMKVSAVFGIIGCLVVTAACNKKNDYSNNVEVVKEWNFTVSSSNLNYVLSGGEATAVFHMLLLADSSLTYDIHGDTAAGDRIVGAEIRLGDPVTDGPVLVNLTLRQGSSYGSGSVTGLRAAIIDQLLNNNVQKYVTITSGRAPNGLVRGQLNSNIVFSKNVALTGASVVPSVPTNTTGTAFLRLTSDNILYSKVVVNKDDPADPVTTATINQGVPSANGPAILNLVSNAGEFGIGKKTPISASISATLLNNSTYVTATSALKPSGKIRGQIR
ncbi:MAG: CHRD domain-containing protein [Bacteroidota bacterium]|nr:CHRD domain-containing protein [Bacteroidota bacterium]